MSRSNSSSFKGISKKGERVNMEPKLLFTAESVSQGHPDKICDTIADAILDECIKQDPFSRTAVEVLATKETIVLAGEISSKAKIDYEKIVRSILREIGYTKPEIGIGCDSCKIYNFIKEQSPDIALGVVVSSERKQTGAGDQGIMYGYATNETKNYMPLNISIAHKIVRYATSLRKDGTLSFARPDMKSQVTIDYTDKPKINALVFSCQTDESKDINEIRKILKEKVLKPVVESFNMTLPIDDEIYINPTGRFVLGGPLGDTGVTGRKIIVDTYGGSAPHGGGAFSGKDPTKVDRSAAYAARHAAKNIVAAKLADRCLIQLSYAIGVSDPISIFVETYNSEKVDKNKILKVLLNKEIFDFTPDGIIDRFSLRKPSFKYQQLSAFGHFGRPDVDLPYEKLDKVDQILSYIKTL